MKVLLTTSGTGSRLGELTQHINKALVRVGKKPAISYIIEGYPKNTEFVVTVGYKAEQIKDFLKLAYPDRYFTFVTVDKYEGPGTSLGYSMLRARSKLQSPFVYHACDTIVEGFKVPSLKENWAMGIKFPDMTQYASFDVGKNGYITRFNKKNMGGLYAHIGLIGVKDYKLFWDILTRLYKENPNDGSLNDTATLTVMVEQGIQIKGVETKNWIDMGNPVSLKDARERISDKFDNLDKVDESLYLFKDFAIKFFSNPKKVKDRVKRGKLLGKLAPKTIGVKDNFYKYQFIKGKTYSEVATAKDFKKFLTWSKKNLWKPKKSVADAEFRKICREFYEQKTKDRVKQFLTSHSLSDVAQKINGEMIPSMSEVLSKVDFDKLSEGVQSHFHGDYILENILKTADGYKLLDWRQDFGGLTTAGDMHYDLAKLYHNLVVNHEIVSNNDFVIENSDHNNITVSINRKPSLQQCESVLEEFVQNEGHDVGRIRILRSIIWINMSPLHHHPFSVFLYYFGKYNLWQTLKESKKL